MYIVSKSGNLEGAGPVKLAGHSIEGLLMSGRGERAIEGALLGTAVGDALGLPYEGLSPGRGARLLGEPDRYRFLLRRGMVSDDTEHSCMVAKALAASGGEVARFRRHLAWGLRLWLLGLPAGIGLATLRATLRLWRGVSPERSGVFSAGNGPAMRSAVIGAAVDDLDEMTRLVKASTTLTHTDPRAFQGAVAVALAARMARDGNEVSGDEYLRSLDSLIRPVGMELLETLRGASESVRRGESTRCFAAGLGLARGVSGYVNHTVPVVLHAWLAHPSDFRAALVEIIRCGGDTDTTAAITGGIVGSGVGQEGIPDEWLTSLAEWPRTVAWMRRLARATDRSTRSPGAVSVPRLFPPAVLLRNVVFFAVVLLHGFRRLLPPY